MNDKKHLSNLGIDINSIRLFKTIDEYNSHTPHIVNAKVVRDTKLTIDGMESKFPKSTVITLPIGMYLNSKRDIKRKVLLKPAKRKFSELYKRYEGQSLENKTLLIFRTGGYSNIMFTQPLCKYLKDKWPTCKIIFACSPRHSLIFKSWPDGLIDQAISYPFITKLLRTVDYHLSLEGATEKNLEGHDMNIFDVHAKIAKSDLEYKKYPVSLKTDKEILRNIKLNLPENFIVLHMIASSGLKMMMTTKWITIINELITKTKYNFVILDGANRSQLYDKLIKEYELDKERIFNASKYSETINEAVNIISLSNGVIGVDSIYTHIGAALNKPVIGLYGPFKGKNKLGYYNNVDWIEPENCECKQYPCFYYGQESTKCAYIESGKPTNCLEHINEKDVVLRFRKLIEG